MASKKPQKVYLCIHNQTAQNMLVWNIFYQTYIYDIKYSYTLYTIIYRHF